MIKKEKLREVILNLCNHYRSECKHSEANAMLELLSIIDGLQEEPECDELNEEIERVSGEIQYWPLEEVARHFAKWQYVQTLKHSIKGRVLRFDGTFEICCPTTPIASILIDGDNRVKDVFIKDE